MRPIAGLGTLEMGGLTLRADPAREACFRVARSDAEMHNIPPDEPGALGEMLHRHMTNEVTSLDIAAACLAEFPEADWGVRMELARQCWDETRHVQALARRLVEVGGRKGEHPITVFEWNVTSAIDNLPGRLASQNRTLEAGAMDVVGRLVRGMRALGDETTAQVLDAILADEVQHVRFANRYIRAEVARDKRVLLQVAMAVRLLAQANAVHHASGGDAPPGDLSDVPAVNVEDRQRAEFSDDEIHEVLRQAGFRTLVAPQTEARP
jgi:uncharacterized ferritin-like protein (DUF455 family)